MVGNTSSEATALRARAVVQLLHQKVFQPLYYLLQQRTQLQIMSNSCFIVFCYATHTPSFHIDLLGLFAIYLVVWRLAPNQSWPPSDPFLKAKSESTKQLNVQYHCTVQRTYTKQVFLMLAFVHNTGLDSLLRVSQPLFHFCSSSHF